MARDTKRMVIQPALLPSAIAQPQRVYRLKRCTKCAKYKPYAAFYVNRATRDGKTHRCIVCVKAWKSEYDKSAAGHKNNRLRKQRDYDKVQARRAVHNAVLRGDIPAASKCICIHCGRQAKHYHHPNGYSVESWFDIEPVCVRCHVDIHDPFVEVDKRQLRLAI